MGIPVTTDEELNLLDQQLRRLKIEYEIFFSNPSKRPPTDIEWKVLNLLRKFSDGQHHPVYGVSQAAAAAAGGAVSSQHFALHNVDQGEREQVERLYNTLVAAKKKAGENVTGNIDSFATFVQKKTEQIRKQYKCDAVEYSVELTDGQVKLKAKAKT